MKQVLFTGSGAALVTPMHRDGSINFSALKQLLDVQIENGTNAVIICGTTGEAPTLSDEEHLEAVGFAVECAAHRVPVIAGTGSNDHAPRHRYVPAGQGHWAPTGCWS